MGSRFKISLISRPYLIIFLFSPPVIRGFLVRRQMKHQWEIVESQRKYIASFLSDIEQKGETLMQVSTKFALSCNKTWLLFKFNCCVGTRDYAVPECSRLVNQPSLYGMNMYQLINIHVNGRRGPHVSVRRHGDVSSEFNKTRRKHKIC